MDGPKTSAINSFTVEILAVVMGPGPDFFNLIFKTKKFIIIK